MEKPDPANDLRLLVVTRHPLITMETVEEDRAARLVMRVSETLQMFCHGWSVTNGWRCVVPADKFPAIPDTETPAQALAHLFHNDRSGIYIFCDLFKQLASATEKRLLREVVERAEPRRQTIVLIEPRLELEDALERLAVPFDLALPDEAQIRAIVQDAAREACATLRARAELRSAEFDGLIRNLRGLTEAEIKRAVWRAVADDLVLNGEDVANLLELKKETVREHGLLEFIEPGVALDDVGGLNNLKHWLAQRQRAFSKEAKDFGLSPPRGVLMLGVQGAGKSLAARAIAAAWNMPLLRLDPGAMYDRYVGQSEKQLRQALKLAEAMSPAVLWIDEIEKGFASAASQSTDGGLSQRMFGSLLTWMQDNRQPIFIVATANDISALPPELMRKGRFDEIFFVDLPGAVAREQIFSVHLKKRKRDPAGFDLKKLAEAAEGFSGAEIEQAVVSGLYTAFGLGRELTDQKLLAELARTKPLSVTMAERVMELRAWAHERCVNAD